MTKPRYANWESQYRRSVLRLVQSSCILILLLLTAQKSLGLSDVDCGPRCLAVTLTALGVDYTLEDLKQRFGKPDKSGYSMTKLSEVAQSYGLQVQTVITSLENLERRKSVECFACICWVSGSHFVVCADYSNGQVTVVDPPTLSAIPAATFVSQWNGESLLIAKNALLPETSLPTPGKFRWILFAVLFVSLAAISARVARRFLIAFLALSVLSLNSATAQEEVRQTTKPVTLHLSKPVLNPLQLGNYVLGTDADVSFEVVNDSSSVKALKAAVISCSCVGVEAESADISVDQSHTVTAGLSTRVGGEQKAVITLQFKDGTTYPIPISWIVTHSLITEPTLLSFGRVETTGVHKLDFEVKRILDDGSKVDAKLTSVQSSSNLMTCSFDGSTVKLELSDCGREQTDVAYIYLRDDQMPQTLTVSLPVSWRKPSPEFFSLPSEFRVIDQGNEPSIRLLIVATKGEIGEIKDVEVIESDLKVKRWDEKRSKKNSSSLQITFAAPEPTAATGRVSIRVKFSDNRSCELFGLFSRFSAEKVDR